MLPTRVPIADKHGASGRETHESFADSGHRFKRQPEIGCGGNSVAPVVEILFFHCLAAVTLKPPGRQKKKEKSCSRLGALTVQVWWVGGTSHSLSPEAR